jgi:hypothetical protein
MILEIMDNERDILDRASSQRIGGADGKLVEELCSEIATLRQELDDADTLREKMAGILSAVAFALKGPPPTLTMHDWSDLGEVANDMVRKCHSAGCKEPVCGRLLREGR